MRLFWIRRRNETNICPTTDRVCAPISTHVEKLERATDPEIHTVKRGQLPTRCKEKSVIRIVERTHYLWSIRRSNRTADHRETGNRNIVNTNSKPAHTDRPSIFQRMDITDKIVSVLPVECGVHETDLIPGKLSQCGRIPVRRISICTQSSPCTTHSKRTGTNTERQEISRVFRLYR